MPRIALTGNIASGKSAVAELLGRWGATIIDADRIVHELERRGSPVLAAIVERFGSDILRPDGELDRARLRDVVMRDAGARAELERIVHPAVQARRLELEAEAAARGDRIIVHDIPLLFEALDPNQFDAVILVDAPEALRRARLVAQRGLSPEDADRLMAAQQPAARKRAWVGGPHRLAPFVIENDADLASLEGRTRQVWDAVRALA